MYCLLSTTECDIGWVASCGDSTTFFCVCIILTFVRGHLLYIVRQYYVTSLICEEGYEHNAISIGIIGYDIILEVAMILEVECMIGITTWSYMKWWTSDSVLIVSWRLHIMYIVCMHSTKLFISHPYILGSSCQLSWVLWLEGDRNSF